MTSKAPPVSAAQLQRAKTIAGFPRITAALILREIQTRFGRDNIGFLWLLVEPAAFCLSIVLLWNMIKHGDENSLPIVPFLLTGYLPMLMYRHAVGRAMRCMQANADFLFHRPVSILALYTARLFAEIISFLGAFVILWLLFAMLGDMGWPQNWPLFIGGWLAYILFAISIALCVGVLSEMSELVDRIWQPVSYITIPISGTFFMVDWLPPPAATYARLFPPITASEMIRGGYFGPAVTIHTNVPVLLFSSGLILLLALWLMRFLRNYVEAES